MMVAEWTLDMDEYLPTAVDAAREYVARHQGNSGTIDDVLRRTQALIRKQFKSVRGLIYVSHVQQRILLFNEGKTVKHSDFINYLPLKVAPTYRPEPKKRGRKPKAYVAAPVPVIAMPPRNEDFLALEVTKEGEVEPPPEQLEEPPKAQVEEQPEAPLLVEVLQPEEPQVTEVQSVQEAPTGIDLRDEIKKLAVPLILVQNRLANNVKIMADQIKEGGDINTLLYDAMLQQHSNMELLMMRQDKLVHAIELMADTMISTYDRLAVLQQLPLPSDRVKYVQSETKKEEVKKRQPMMPPANKHIRVITREDVCYGESWEKLSARVITEAERIWQDFYVNYGVVNNDDKRFIDRRVMIVYGWSAALREVQEIFYRLAPVEIYWIETDGLSFDTAATLVNRIHPSNGQMCVVTNKRPVNISDRPSGEFHKDLDKHAIAMCNKHKMPWARNLRNPHTGIDTHTIAEALIKKQVTERYVDYLKLLKAKEFNQSPPVPTAS